MASTTSVLADDETLVDQGFSSVSASLMALKRHNAQMATTLVLKNQDIADLSSAKVGLEAELSHVTNELGSAILGAIDQVTGADGLVAKEEARQEQESFISRILLTTSLRQSVDTQLKQLADSVDNVSVPQAVSTALEEMRTRERDLQAQLSSVQLEVTALRSVLLDTESRCMMAQRNERKAIQHSKQLEGSLARMEAQVSRLRRSLVLGSDM
ncbi:hypothetical protein KIPB_008506 [Kipferlia bialata]|uniref:Uncharacterized protein n=1 Tax=Kipferlia bialata TaxID=797122 RepID=A0A391NXK3_9EUKA|nr:hypothetical protein KIPB_008506 [Kipferlia bialata]|eukprot:g8506.t1